MDPYKDLNKHDHISRQLYYVFYVHSLNYKCMMCASSFYEVIGQSTVVGAIVLVPSPGRTTRACSLCSSSCSSSCSPGGVLSVALTALSSPPSTPTLGGTVSFARLGPPGGRLGSSRPCGGVIPFPLILLICRGTYIVSIVNKIIFLEN